MPAPTKIRFGLLAVSFSSLFLLTSCGRFFVPNQGGGGSTCTNCVYIANSGTDDVAQFAVTNPLSVVASTNASAGVIPSSIAVSPTGPYVYVGSVSGGILLFPIDTGGALGTVTTASDSVGPYALAIDPTGNWLVAASLSTTSCSFEGTSATGYEYTLTSFPIGSSGELGTGQTVSFSCGSTTAPPTDLVICPDDSCIFMTAGGVGLAGATFDTSTGAMSVYPGLSITLNSAVTSYNAVAVDPTSKYIFLASSGTGGGLTQYALPSSLTSGALSKVGSAVTPIDSFYAVAVPGAGGFVYVSDRSTGKVYGYSYTGTSTMTAISGSPFSPSSASDGTIAMVADSSGKYILTINSQSGPNLQQFSIGSTGALTATSTGTTSSGSWSPIALAVTGTGS